MVRLSGRHTQLSEYVDKVIEQSVDVRTDMRPSTTVFDLRTFFLNGSLCYKPLTRVNFTFEACVITPAHRKALNDLVSTGSEVPYAAPQTTGFGFSLEKAISSMSGTLFADLNESELETDQFIGRLKFQDKSVETIYGYWMPSAYANVVTNTLDEIVAKNRARLQLFADELQHVSVKSLENKLEKHIEGLQDLFRKNSRKIEPKHDYKISFEKFFKTRKAWMADEHRLAHMARRLHLEQMPDIWGDADGAARFESSFFENLSLRFDVRRMPKIVGVLKDKLDLSEESDPTEIRSALERRLKDGFDTSVWNTSSPA